MKIGVSLMTPEDERRRDEAIELLIMIGDAENIENEKSRQFCSDMFERWEKYDKNWRVSQKQLFWLRDIKDKLI